MKTILSTAFVMLAMAVPICVAHAGDASLTEERINAFYEESLAAQKAGLVETIGFLEEHVHENSTTVINTISHMQGAPQNKQAMTLNKQELLRETEKGRQAMDLKSIENKILSVTVAADGRSAQVKDTTYSTLVLKMPGPGGQPVQFNVEQSMLCDTEIVLNDANVIQNKNNVCNSEVNIKPLTK